MALAKCASWWWCVLHLPHRAKGVEKQFRYNCELCDTCVGYRSVPYDEDSKYIYILPEVSLQYKRQDLLCMHIWLGLAPAVPSSGR